MQYHDSYYENEVLCALDKIMRGNMLFFPFFKEIESEHQQQVVKFNNDELRKSSKIFNCTNPTRYQQSVNDAAFELCKVDPSLILKKGKLFEEARKKVDSAGYDYVKVSRSIVYGSASKPSKPKRKYIGSEICATRIKELKEQISSLGETVELLTKQKQQFSNAEKFLQAADMNSSILEKGKEKWKLEKELKALSKADAKSKSSAKKKRKRQEAEEKRQSSKFLNSSQDASSIDLTESLPSTDVQRSDSNDGREEQQMPLQSWKGSNDDREEPPWRLRREDGTVGMKTFDDGAQSTNITGEETDFVNLSPK